MKKPKIMIHILSALDGKITGPFMELPSVRNVSNEYGRIRSEYHANAWLYGTTTTKEFTGYRQPVLEEMTDEISDTDYIACKNAELYYVSVDALGEIGWESGMFRKSGRQDAHVIEVLTEKVSGAYRSYFNKRGVSYILAGKDRLDCKIACEKLYRLFGIQKMLICGGGLVNWTFLQEGMVDELSLILAPAADGCTDTAMVFEQFSLLKRSIPVEFHMKKIERLHGDGVRLVYTVRNNSGADRSI